MGDELLGVVNSVDALLMCGRTRGCREYSGGVSGGEVEAALTSSAGVDSGHFGRVRQQCWPAVVGAAMILSAPRGPARPPFRL
jgi:hypothetical protein